jgi:transposase-like protein
MSKIERLESCNDWIGLEFVERERTPREITEPDIQHHVAGLSLWNTKQVLDRLGVKHSRTAVHNWLQKTDVQPRSGAEPITSR